MQDTASRPPTIKTGTFILGIIFLAVAIAATLMLVLQHIAGLELPGCGPGSPCAQLAASAWGKVPGVGWPVSHVGLAYFVALLAGWLISRGGVGSGYRNLVRLGAALSLMFIIVMAVQGHFCMYCVITHAANLAFWLAVEFAAKATPKRGRPMLAASVTFVAASLGLLIAESNTKANVQRKGEQQLAESTREIIRSTSQKGVESAQSTGVTAQPDSRQPIAPKRWPHGFTGRHRIGPDDAPIRIVVLSDYQCPDCQRVEQNIAAIMAARQDVSIAFKHFPMCKDCNRHLSMTLHSNACWAARAAETAAILRGEEGFWQMHRWLFDHKGMFKDDDLNGGLLSLGYDPHEFTTLMQDDTRTLSGIYDDVEDGQWLGLMYTPMVFINGVEVRGAATVVDSVPRAVDALAATNPPRMTCENDQPPPAAQKYLDDWREQPVRTLPAPPRAWPIGPDNAHLKVTVWGDMQEANSAKVDAIVRKFITARSDAQYTFRNYPVNQDCNPSSQVSKHPKACLAHRAAIAAGLLGGLETYWKMHTWVMANIEQLSEEGLKQSAAQMGLDVPALLQKMDSPEVAQIIQRDAAAGRAMNLTAVPTIYINGRFVPRWLREGDNILERMLTEASH